jgi:hypothetical protein
MPDDVRSRLRQKKNGKQNQDDSAGMTANRRHTLSDQEMNHRHQEQQQATVERICVEPGRDPGQNQRGNQHVQPAGPPTTQGDAADNR